MLIEFRKHQHHNCDSNQSTSAPVMPQCECSKVWKKIKLRMKLHWIKKACKLHSTKISYALSRRRRNFLTNVYTNLKFLKSKLPNIKWYWVEIFFKYIRSLKLTNYIYFNIYNCNQLKIFHSILCFIKSSKLY